MKINVRTFFICCSLFYILKLQYIPCNIAVLHEYLNYVNSSSLHYMNAVEQRGLTLLHYLHSKMIWKNSQTRRKSDFLKKPKDLLFFTLSLDLQ